MKKHLKKAALIIGALCLVVIVYLMVLDIEMLGYSGSERQAMLAVKRNGLLEIGGLFVSGVMLAMGFSFIKFIKNKVSYVLDEEGKDTPISEDEDIPNPLKYKKITREEAIRILTRRGVEVSQAEGIVNLFEGAIYQYAGEVGERFIVTESSLGTATGVFVTQQSAGMTSKERIQNMALAPNNKAETESEVEIIREQQMLAGKIAPRMNWTTLAADGISRTGGISWKA